MSSWPVDWPADHTFDTPEEKAQQRLAEAYATSTLRALTLYRVGGESIAVAPHAPACAHDTTRIVFLLPDEHYRGCREAPHVLLDAPVGSVEEVRVNGAVLPPESYQIEDGNKLVRTDGKPWPSTHGWDFIVKYTNGHPVDIMGRHVAGILASEWLKAIRGDRRCRLPSGVTNIARAGVTMEVKADMFADGLTGINEVDHYVRLWNPHGLRSRPGVYSVDMEPARREPRYGGVW